MNRLSKLSAWAGFGIALASNFAIGQTAMIEPAAGNWKTFAISSGKDYRVPPPPDAAATRNEIAWIKSVRTAESGNDRSTDNHEEPSPTDLVWHARACSLQAVPAIQASPIST